MTDILIPIIQAFLFYLIPTMIGRPIVQRFLKTTLFYPFVTYFITGGFILFLSALITEYAVRTVFPAVPFHTTFSGIVASLSLLSLPLNILTRKQDLRLREIALPTVASILAALPIAALWTHRSPYSFNWDMLEHQTLVNNIFQGKFSFMTSQITDTFGFDGYSTFFHTLIASSQVYFPTDMFVYWQAIGFIHFVFVILASYVLTKEVTENKTLAYIALVLSAGIFDSYISFTSLFFIPQTFTAVVSIFLLAQLFKHIKNGYLPSWMFMIYSSLFVLLNHYIIGFGAVGIYGMIYLYSKCRVFIARHINGSLLVAGIGVLAIAAIVMSAFIPLDFLNSGEAVAFTPSWDEKLRIMRQAYGWLLAIFLPLGVATVLRFKGEVEVLMLTITFLLISVVLLQFPYVIKFYVLARFFIHIILAIGIYACIRNMHSTILRSTAYALLGVALVTIFITNSASWKEILRYHDGYTNISPNEVQAAEFLKQNYAGQQALLISDPATQHILEPLSTVNTQGGAYMKNPARELLNSTLSASTPAEAAESLIQIHDYLEGAPKKTLFAISGRYLLWQYSAPEDKASLSFNIWYPSDLTMENLQVVQYFEQDKKHFQKVYENPTIVIFEVKSQ